MLGVVVVGGRFELVTFSPKRLAYRIPDESLRDPRLLLSNPRSLVKRIEAAGIGEPLGHLGELEVEVPVISPGKIVGVGRNYGAHAREMGVEAPEEPDLFLKAPSSLIGYGHQIVVPGYVAKPDYEGEIVLVIGSRLKESSVAEARNAILGYTAGNDVTSRDLQVDRGKPWSMAKSIDTFSPLGPYIRVINDSSELDDVCLETRLSGEVVQRGCVSDMILDPARLVSYISKYMTLYPGDVIYTGTPPGVGHARSPPRYLRDGDIVEVRVEGIHPLVNRVVRRVMS
ncbi:MAG: fumarylacetoacetate hydrolase family protein [Desulfurococcales archaeon]|nr:fumarylacetoacetate hydrolase family protein [Desulfurococcales archaeon]